MAGCWWRVPAGDAKSSVFLPRQRSKICLGLIILILLTFQRMEGPFYLTRKVRAVEPGEQAGSSTRFICAAPMDRRQMGGHSESRQACAVRSVAYQGGRAKTFD